MFLCCAIFVTVSFMSCKKTQPCYHVSCTNGTCVDGRCKCDTGYEGSKCQSEIRTKFIGTFTGEEPCSITGTATYSVYIEANDTNVAAVNFRNLWGAGDYIYTSGEIGVDGNIYIPRQRIYGYYTWITGKAMMINGKLKVSYSIEDGMFGNQTDNCVWQQQ